ncbi:immunoglobulin domain-containing protein [Verrucomicrobiaceae bacterium 227]
MRRFVCLASVIAMLFVPVVVSGQGASFGGKKVTHVVDFTDGGVSTGVGTYSTISKVQIAGDAVIFSAYGGENLDEIAILSADGSSVQPLLELGAGALVQDVSLRLGDFRYLGEDEPLLIPVITQTQNDFPRLAFLSNGSLSEVAGPSTIVPGSLNDRFTQYLGVVSYDDEVAFVGISRDGHKGVYLATGGTIHDLSDYEDPESELDESGFGNRVVFEGSTVFFFHGDDDPKNIYSSTLEGEPFLVASGSGQINDKGVFRDYQAREVFAGEAGEITFLAEILGDTFQSQWAFLQTSVAGLEVVARSRSLLPIDGKSAGLSLFWEPYFDGERSFVGGVNQVYGGLSESSITPQLQVFSGSPALFLADIESGNSALIEVSATPKRIWAELGILGPVEIPTPPLPQVVASGSPAVFQVVAEGLEPFTYRWFLNGELLPLSTTDTLTVRNVSFNSVGSVRVVVSNEIDSEEAFATLDVSEPPEVIIAPGDQEGLVGESLEVLFQTRGQRPISYEFLEAPEGSSLEISAVQSGAIFDIHGAQSDFLNPGDSGRYTVRASSPAGVTEFSFVLTVVGGTPPNSQFRAKPFDLLTDHNAAEFLSFPNGFRFSGPVVFDEVNDRFLTSPLVDSSESLFAISSDGLTTPILDGNALQGITNVVLLGFQSDHGIVFQGTQDSQGRKALFSHKNGVTSTLVSASDLQDALEFGPNFSRFEFKLQNGGIVGLVEGSGEWAVVQIDEGITRLVSSFDSTPMENADGYLGCDELFRPLFHTGFEVVPGNAALIYGPLVQRVELNGLVTTLRTGYLPQNEIDSSRVVSSVPSNAGVKFLAWGERLIEIIDERLEVHQMNETTAGGSIFLPQMEQAHASKYRVFFPGVLSNNDLTREEFEELGLLGQTPDSIQRKIFSWTVGGITEAFSGRYFEGLRVNAGELGRDPVSLLNVVGDQVLLSGQFESEGTRSFLMFNQAKDFPSTALSFQRSRGDLYLDIPMGTRLQSSGALVGPWEPTVSKAGSFSIQPNAGKRFFLLTPR